MNMEMDQPTGFLTPTYSQTSSSALPLPYPYHATQSSAANALSPNPNISYGPYASTLTRSVTAPQPRVHLSTNWTPSSAPVSPLTRDVGNNGVNGGINSWSSEQTQPSPISPYSSNVNQSSPISPYPNNNRFPISPTGLPTNEASPYMMTVPKMEPESPCNPGFYNSSSSAVSPSNLHSGSAYSFSRGDTNGPINTSNLAVPMENFAAQSYNTNSASSTAYPPPPLLSPPAPAYIQDPVQTNSTFGWSNNRNINSETSPYDDHPSSTSYDRYEEEVPEVTREVIRSSQDEGYYSGEGNVRVAQNQPPRISVSDPQPNWAHFNSPYTQDSGYLPGSPIDGIPQRPKMSYSSEDISSPDDGTIKKSDSRPRDALSMAGMRENLTVDTTIDRKRSPNSAYSVYSTGLPSSTGSFVSGSPSYLSRSSSRADYSQGESDYSVYTPPPARTRQGMVPLLASSYSLPALRNKIGKSKGPSTLINANAPRVSVRISAKRKRLVPNQKIPAPVADYSLTKKTRGRHTAKNPEQIDSNVVHVCPIDGCNACFKRREHVKRHIRGIHTEEKPFVCEFAGGCNKLFSRRDNLKAHHLAKHGCAAKEPIVARDV